MQVRICDKCHKPYVTFSEQMKRFPIFEVNIIRNYESCIRRNEFAKVYLCSKCQKAVYEFIFGKEEER